MSTRRVPALAAAAAAAIAVAALPGLIDPAVRPAAAANQTVRIMDGPDPRAFGFQPPTLSVTVGDVVTWTNSGALQHTVTSETGAFDSGLIAPGQSFAQTFSTAGSFNYFCAVHPNMRGTINVGTQTANPAASPAGGAAPAASPTPIAAPTTSTFTGSPAVLIVVDEPAVNGRIFGPALAKGWAIDVTSTSGPGIDQVQLYLDGDRGSGQLVGNVNYGQPRPDVASNRNDQTLLNSGYSLGFDASQLRPGKHTLTVAVHSNTNGWAARTVPVVVGPELRVQTDAQVVGAPNPYTIPGGFPGAYGPYGPSSPYGPYGPGYGPYGPTGLAPGVAPNVSVQVNVRVSLPGGQPLPGAQVAMGGVTFPPTDPGGFTTQVVPFSQVQTNGLVGKVTVTWQDITAESDVYIYNY